MYDIVVLGAGVVGMSTAANIQLRLPGRHVTVVADKFGADTTSDGAAGIFRPTLEKTPAKCEKQFRRWCVDSFKWYHQLNTNLNPADTGVTRVSGYQVFNEPTSQLPFHHDITYDFKEMTERELASINGNHRHGWKSTTLMTECRRYLPWLTDRFLKRGGLIEERTVGDINEFAGKCSVLVNCAGMGSKHLLNDHDVFPVRGHLIRVRAPWIKHFYIWNDGNSYIYPGMICFICDLVKLGPHCKSILGEILNIFTQDNVVLGGTRQPHINDTSQEGPWFDEILAQCERRVPGVKAAAEERRWVGFRPHRTHVRLEHETVTCGKKRLQVVHNYGHGANGVALSWGTAVEASDIVARVLGEAGKSPAKTLRSHEMLADIIDEKKEVKKDSINLNTTSSVLPKLSKL